MNGESENISEFATRKRAENLKIVAEKKILKSESHINKLRKYIKPNEDFKRSGIVYLYRKTADSRYFVPIQLVTTALLIFCWNIRKGCLSRVYYDGFRVYSAFSDDSFSFDSFIYVYENGETSIDSLITYLIVAVILVGLVILIDVVQMTIRYKKLFLNELVKSTDRFLKYETALEELEEILLRFPCS